MISLERDWEGGIPQGVGRKVIARKAEAQGCHQVLGDGIISDVLVEFRFVYRSLLAARKGKRRGQSVRVRPGIIGTGEIEDGAGNEKEDGEIELNVRGLVACVLFPVFSASSFPLHVQDRYSSWGRVGRQMN